MTHSRTIPLAFHGILETFAALALIAAPFVLEFEPAVGAASIALGALLMGLSLSTHGDRRTVSPTAHAGFDYLIGTLSIVAGLVAGIGGAGPVATAFLVGFGAAHLALTASTRFSIRGA